MKLKDATSAKSGQTLVNAESGFGSAIVIIRASIPGGKVTTDNIKAKRDTLMARLGQAITAYIESTDSDAKDKAFALSMLSKDGKLASKYKGTKNSIALYTAACRELREKLPKGNKKGKGKDGGKSITINCASIAQRKAIQSLLDVLGVTDMTAAAVKRLVATIEERDILEREAA